jgi:rubrerythrin
MEAIAALGLACNVMQLISFGRETIQVARHAHTAGTVEEDLADKAAHLSTLGLMVEDSLQSAMKPQTKAQRDLQEAGRKCRQAAAELGDEIAKLCPEPGEKTSAFRAVKTSVKVMGRKSRLKKLEEMMLHWGKVIDSGLLLQIWWVPPVQVAVILSKEDPANQPVTAPRMKPKLSKIEMITTF